ncbi:fatty acyl-CoA reductase wat-like [Armigeres subalbatus]|uniref:fatty acyl-CoA reductase wat-like n=1 Tax=Armigeres subalbatus TaxID=124917 RepID=UPI002ED36FC5
MLEQIFTSDDAVRDPAKSAHSPIRNFFRDRTVFLTGGTGFLGKLFIEKLLQCEVREIILLIRSKRGRTPRERLQRQLEREPIYTQYSRNANYYWSKLRIMEGALEQDELGLSEIDIDYLRTHVEIVIHSAADVRFDLSLKASFRANVFGAQQLVRIALGMRKLISFLYISTAYSNCIQEVVEEKFYDTDVDPEEMMRVVDAIDEQQLDTLSRKIIQPWPNTYTYAKAQAEVIFRKYCDRLPIVLIRPSIIISTLEDPIEGWTDNIYGLNGVITGIGSGVLRILHLHADYCVDTVPADLAVNASLATIWYTAKQAQAETKGNERVFNCISRTDNPFTYRDVRTFCVKFRGKIPALQTLWFPTVTFIQSATLHWILQIFYHFIPAIFFDIFAKLSGREAKVLFLYRKVQQFADALEFFTTNQWTFDNTRMRKVYESMSEDDKQCFPADVRLVKWADFMNIYVLGLRKYILKENMNNLDQALRKFRTLKMAHYTVVTLIYLAMTWISFLLVRSFWSSFASHWFSV